MGKTYRKQDKKFKAKIKKARDNRKTQRSLNEEKSFKKVVDSV